MKDFLVKLSRNSKIMVPVVAVLALGIYSGSYVIRHRDTVAKQEEQSQQEDQARKAAENFETIQPQEKTGSQGADDSTAEKDTQSADSGTDKEAPDVEKVSMTVNVGVSGNNVTVTANYGSSKPGTCTVQLLQDGDLLDTQTGDASNGQCTITLNKPNVTGEVKAQVTYAATDKSAKAVEDKDFKL